MFHIHWFKEHHKSTFYSYQECRCNKRRALKLYYIHGHQPLERHWLEHKKYIKATPPNTRSGRIS